MKTEVKVLQLLLKFPVTFPVLIPSTLIVLLSVHIPPPFPAVLSLKLLPPVMVREMYHSLISVRIRILSIAYIPPPWEAAELFLNVMFPVKSRTLLCTWIPPLQIQSDSDKLLMNDPLPTMYGMDSKHHSLPI